MDNVRITNLSSTLVQWLTEMATLALIWYGGYLIFKGQASIGEVVAFIHLLRQLYFPVNRISEMNTVLHNSLAAIDRIFEVFDTQPDVRERPRRAALPRLSGDIRFERVYFGYRPGQVTLRGIDLHMRAGEMIALVGPSGAGKTTLVQLIPRFFDPDAGRVTVDGYDLRDVTLRSLRSQIGIVAQDTVLLSGSVRDNILYGMPDASDEALRRVARAAHAEEFIVQLPEGYDTLLGERGAKLSGGQRQRIAIARAFLRDPRILILDEATSALDSESEHLIQDALRQLMREPHQRGHRAPVVHDPARRSHRRAGPGPHRPGRPARAAAGRGRLYGRLYERQFRAGPAPGQLSLVKPPAAAAG